MGFSDLKAHRLQAGGQTEGGVPFGSIDRWKKKGNGLYGQRGIFQRLFSPLVLGVSLLLSSKSYAANEVTIIPTDPFGTNRAISLFDGANLPTNGFFRIGTFLGGGTNSSDLASYVSGWAAQPNASSLLTFLNNDFVDWNSSNTTTTNWPGTNSLTLATTNTNTVVVGTNPPVSVLLGKPMYIWVYNTTSHAGATNDGSQMLILRSWETNNLGSGFPDKDGGAAGSDSPFNLFPSSPSGVTFQNPDNPDDPTDLLSAYGVSVLFGQYLSDSLQFRLGGITPGSEITSVLAKTNARGFPATYQIRANNGPDRYFATTNTAGVDLTETSLPTGFSMSTNTGVITVATNAAAGTYPIRLVASNSVTAVVATNTLTWVLKDPTLLFTNSANQDLISITTSATNTSSFSFISTGTNPTFSVAKGDLFGLSFDSDGTLRGAPNRTGEDFITINSFAGDEVGAFTFRLVVSSFGISVDSGFLEAGTLVATSGISKTVLITNTGGFTDLTGSISPERTGVSFNGSNLIIATNAQPLAKGTTNVTLTLTATRAGTPVSASTNVPLRIVAPVPTGLVGTNEFEVVVCITILFGLCLMI